MPTDSIGYLRLPQVLKLFPVSKSTWWSGVKTGRFPAGVKLSERTTAWRVEDIRKLIERDPRRHGVAGRQSPELKPGLGVLIERGYIMDVGMDETGKPGRPKGPYYLVNPIIKGGIA